MPFVKTGALRSMSLSITKNGNDGTSLVMSPTSNPPHPLLDGKSAFGSYPAITEDEMQKMDMVAFSDRVGDWQINLQSAYATSDPDMWDDIQASFKYTRGIVVRLINPGIRQYQLTTYPFTMEESFSMQVEDPFNDTLYNLEIPEGSTNSNTITLNEASTTDPGQFGQHNATAMTLGESYYGAFKFYQTYDDIGFLGPIQYPLPQ